MQTNQGRGKSSLSIFSITLLCANFGLMALVWVYFSPFRALIRELPGPVSTAMRVVLATPAIFGILGLALVAKEFHPKKTTTVGVNIASLCLLAVYFVFCFIAAHAQISATVELFK